MIDEKTSAEANEAAGKRLTGAIEAVGGMSETMKELVELSPEISTGCVPCDHGREHGFWGKGNLPDNTWTHCKDCHVSFPGTQRWGHCSGCCNTFSGITAFDAHQSTGNCPPKDADEYGHKTVFVRKYHEKGEFYYYGSKQDDDS